MDKFILSVTSRKLTNAGGPRSFTVGTRDFLVGSASDCDFVLSSTGIEGRHLVFRPREDLLVLVPLTRRGEISLNSRVVKHAVVLSEGDVVSVADTRIEVKVERSKKAKPVVPPRTKDDDFDEDGAAVAADVKEPEEKKRSWPKVLAVCLVLCVAAVFAFRHFDMGKTVAKKAPGLSQKINTLVPDLMSEPVEEKAAAISVAPLLEEVLPETQGDGKALVMERPVKAPVGAAQGHGDDAPEEEDDDAEPVPEQDEPEKDKEDTKTVQELPEGQQDSPETKIKWMSIDAAATETEELFAPGQSAEDSTPAVSKQQSAQTPAEQDVSDADFGPALVPGAPVPVETLLAVTDDYSSGRIERALADIRKICAASPEDKSAQKLKNRIETVDAAWKRLSRASTPAGAYLSASKIVETESDTSNFYRRTAANRLGTLLEKPDVLAEECRQNGLRLQAEGRHEEALENFRVALSFNPDDRMSKERIRTLELILKNRRSSLYKAGYVLEPGDKAQAEKIWDRL